MASSDQRIQALVSSVADRVRDDLQREITGLVQRLEEVTAEERENAARAARTEAESAAASLLSNAIAAERGGAAEHLKAAVEQARADERQADLARAERLLDAVRALDGAASLSDTLDKLTTSARDESGRTAVLVVRGDVLKVFSHAGFAPGVVDAQSPDLSIASAGLLGDAIRESSAKSTTAAADGGHVPWPFTPASSDRVGLAVPILVDEQVVAVLYADDDGVEEREVPSAWPERVELLARHAGRCLEALTARSAARARAGHPVPATLVDVSKSDAEGAQRFARLLISEIKLYHEAQVDEGRRARDLRQRLHSHIERARQLYEERVPADLRARTDYFEQELVRTLADGDPILLGQAS
jgi:hypothetical protein